jgi:hypothetical protein
LVPLITWRHRRLISLKERWLLPAFLLLNGGQNISTTTSEGLQLSHDWESAIFERINVFDNFVNLLSLGGIFRDEVFFFVYFLNVGSLNGSLLDVHCLGPLRFDDHLGRPLTHLAALNFRSNLRILFCNLLPNLRQLSLVVGFFRVETPAVAVVFRFRCIFFLV